MFKTAKVDLKGSLPPGVYSAARRIANSPFGVHRFLILVPREPKKFQGKMTNIGGGQKGIIVGALNAKQGFFRPGQLRYHRNNKNDVAAARELLKNKQEGGGYWSTTIDRVVRSDKQYTDKEIQEIMDKARKYRSAARKQPVEYPSLISNIMNRGENSNTFVASLLDYSGHKDKELDMNVPGFDPGSQLRLPREMFGNGNVKTAADVLMMSKEALSLEDIKAGFKKTDPRWWTTPAGAAAGVALLHALGDPGKRSRLRYLMAGGAGAAGGWGAGSALKEYSPTFNPELGEAMADKEKVPGTPVTSLKPRITPKTSWNDAKRQIFSYVSANPELLLKDEDPEMWDEIYKYWKSKAPDQPLFEDSLLPDRELVRRFAQTGVSDLIGTKLLSNAINPAAAVIPSLGGTFGESNKEIYDEIYAKTGRAKMKAHIARQLKENLQDRVSEDVLKDLTPVLDKAMRYGHTEGFRDKESPIFGLDTQLNRRTIPALVTGGPLLGGGVEALKAMASRLSDTFIRPKATGE